MMRHIKIAGLWRQILRASVAVFFQKARRGMALLASLIMLLLLAAPAKATLPTPLSDFDVAQYTRLFALQQQGNMKQATREMGRLQNPLLKGHLLSQRYLHPNAWRSSYAELSSWLKLYNDHPDASRIFWLAKRRKPKNTRDPKSPKPGYLNGYGYAGLYGYAVSYTHLTLPTILLV